jgi:site-specific recombinase XerC
MPKKLTVSAEARRLIDRIGDSSKISDIRDRVIIALIGSTSMSINAIAELCLKDFHLIEGRWWVGYVDKGTKRDVLLSIESEQYLRHYLELATYDESLLLFRATSAGGRQLGKRSMTPHEILLMIDRRTQQASKKATRLRSTRNRPIKG